MQKKLPIEEREILIYRQSPEHDLQPYDSLKTHEIHYNMAFAAKNNYGYIVYSIISQYDPTVSIEKDKVTIKHTKILSKGLIENLKSSESDPRYKEFDFNYRFRLDNSLFGESSSFSQYSYKQGIGDERYPFSLDIIINKNNGFRTTQDIGVILYKFPFPKNKHEDYDLFKVEYQKIIDNNNFNIDSFANSEKYKHNHIKGAARMMRKNEIPFNFDKYIVE